MVSLQGVTADTVDRTLRLDMVKGDIAALADGEILVDENGGQGQGVEGRRPHPDRRSARPARQELTLGGTYAENQIAGSYLIGLDTYEQNYSQKLDQVVADDGHAGRRRGRRCAPTSRPPPGASNLEIRDQSEFKAEQRKQINQLLGFILVLLALAVLIAALGIVNTLALSVIERTREIGLLRAVGMGRRQVRRMIRLESVVIAIFGTLLGLALGVALGLRAGDRAQRRGDRPAGHPVRQLRAVPRRSERSSGWWPPCWPARRAARLDVLRAITTE